MPQSHPPTPAFFIQAQTRSRRALILSKSLYSADPQQNVTETQCRHWNGLEFHTASSPTEFSRLLVKSVDICLNCANNSVS